MKGDILETTQRFYHCPLSGGASARASIYDMVMRNSAFICAVACLVAAVPAFGQPVDTIQNTRGRAGTSLDGAWQYLLDPYEAGYYDFHMKPIADGGLGSNRVTANKGDEYELAFTDLTPTLQVPGDWNTQRPELLWYEGTVWYRRIFDYTPKEACRQFLWFGAANYQAIVYLNGKKVGEHAGGFTPFQFEVTGKLRERGNAVIVKVDDQRKPDAIPMNMTDWWNYGGLTRGVKRIEVPETFIQDYVVQLEKGSRDRIAGWVRLNGSKKHQKVTIRVPEAGASTVAETDDSGDARFAFPATVTLWSPESPKLYNVEIAAESDHVADRIGFRSIETSGQKILLNGKPVFLRGVAMHAEAPVRSGRVFSDAAARVPLTWAKELGCNFVHLAHYPHHEVMSRLADEMGLLVWSEVPVYWAVQWESQAAYANAEHQLTEMIMRDKTRASVVFWSVANETPLGDARTRFLGSLAAKAHELDPTRLVTAATLPHNSDPKTITIEDPLGKYLDVLGCNEYLGWYDGGPSKPDTITFKTVYDKPLVMSEFGAEARYGRHGDVETAWTEEYQANIYRHQLGMLQRIPFLQGMADWILMDFRCPRRFLSGIQDGYNREGLISDRGDKKMAYSVLTTFTSRPRDKQLTSLFPDQRLRVEHMLRREDLLRPARIGFELDADEVADLAVNTVADVASKLLARADPGEFRFPGKSGLPTASRRHARRCPPGAPWRGGVCRNGQSSEYPPYPHTSSGAQNAGSS
jgi:beta-glucuronidase